MNRLLSSSVLLPLTLIAGCNVTVPVHLDSALLAQRGNQILALPVGERVRPGDRVSLVLQADRSVHVYVFQIDAAKGASRIYPEQEDEPVVAGLPLRIPARGSFTKVPNVVIFSNTVPLPVEEQKRRAEKAARKRRKRLPGATHQPLVVQDTSLPPGSIGEVRGGEELRRIAAALGSTTDARESDDSSLRLWLTEEQVGQGETRTNGAQ